MTAQPVINVEGLSAGYGGVPIVRNLSLTVGAGEVVALLGPNGAGKTTTLLTLSGLLAPIAGQVDVLGATILGVRPHLLPRRGVAHVPEDRSLFFDLTVEENIRLGSTGDRTTRRDARDRALTLFPALQPLARRKAGLLSGGEQQMLAMARVMVAEPRVVLIDEPSEGLAPMIVAEVFAIIREMRKAGTIVLLVEQNVHEAISLCDRFMVLERGQAILTGEGDDDDDRKRLLDVLAV